MSGLSYILDDVTVSVPIALKAWSLPGLSRPVEDVAEILVSRGPAHRDRGLHLKTQHSWAVSISKLDDKIIHRLAVARLLDRNAAYTAVLKHRLLTAEKSRQIIGDHLVFVGEASATGQFGGC